MVTAEERGRRTLSEHIERSLNRLDQQALTTLLENPDRLDAALDAAVQRTLEGKRVPERLGSAPGERLSERESREWVAARTRRRPLEDECLGVTEVAELLGLGSRQAVHGRRARGTLIGFVNGRRDVLFPRAQFDERGRVPAGLDAVLAVFDGDGWEAWTWLTTPTVALDEARPLERLRKGDTALVVAAARGHLQGDFG